VLIRPFRPADRATVIDLWHRCGITRPWNDPDRDIDRKLAVRDDLFLVGEGGGGHGGGHSGRDGDERDGEHRDGLIATMMVGYDGHRGWVNYLAVHPDCRGQGLGRMLMCEAERRLTALGCPKLNLQVRSDNEAVLAFYRALGYEIDAAVSLGKRLIADDR